MPRRFPLRLLMILALPSCGQVSAGAPSEDCAELGAQCRLPEGPLGVCVAVDSAECAEPPCLVCQPQH